MELVKVTAALNSKAVVAWAEAHKESGFSKSAPLLEEQIKIQHQAASYKIKGGVSEEARKINEKARASLNLKEGDECYKGYNQVLLTSYEAGFKDEHLQVLSKAKNSHHDNSYIRGDWDVKKQIEFSTRISKEIGFDTDAGRLDVSTHPLSGGARPTDVRMTTHYIIDNFQEGITGTIHETGHFIYEQGRNMEYDNTPCLPGSFIRHPRFQGPSHEKLQYVTPEQLYNAFNRVEPGFIRDEADEVTYPLHIVLRYEIEKALVEGDISVADVPSIRNAKMKEYLGLDFTDDHFDAAKKAIPNLDEHLAKAEFHVLKKWLNKNIHKQGSLRESGDYLIPNLTGKSLDSSLYIQDLNDKYTKIYDI
ncbi:hypothetical protein BG000_000701 [Podila horticola]|nr:hypothetical protein BG000_000701 [Podila horticola]